MSQLTITDVPPGARLWVDGEATGLAPTAEGEWDVDADVDAGNHDVIAELSTGERRWLLRVWIAEGETLSVPFATLEGAETHRPATPATPAPTRSPWRALLLAGAVVGTVGGLAWLVTGSASPSPARSPA